MSAPEHLESPSPGRPSGDAASGAATPLAEALSRLEHAVTEIHGSETFHRYLNAQARFHHYSWGNVLLMLAQRPDITQVAGYRTWQTLGRQVRKGEHGLRILVPRQRRIAMEQDSPDDEPEQDRRLFFGVGHVWDVSQTEGESLPQVAVPVLQGDAGADLYGHLASVATSEGVAIEQTTELDGETMGTYQLATRTVTLRQAAQQQMTKTLAHELVHHFEGASASRAADETVAESAAYVVCARFGLDTGERSFPYIAGWTQETALLKVLLTRIQAVSARLIDRVEAQGAAQAAASKEA